MKQNSTINYKKELNNEQLSVVSEGDGPCLVLAGAGSGKTRTLVYRIAYLLEKGVAPENILLMTFTNKAAKEMVSRIEGLIGSRAAKGLWGGTFHHVGHRILRRYAATLGYAPTFTIVDMSDADALLKEILKNKGLEKHPLLPKVAVVRDIISYANNTRMTLQEVLETRYSYLDEAALPFIEDVAQEYRARKQKHNCMDFDDLLVLWLRLLNEYESVAKKLQQQFHYILIDEYQDTNALQAAVIHEMGKGSGNMLVVGDDAQSIYSFRGADVANILSFPKQYPHTKTFHIETNYRSTPEILSLAQESISRNNEQFEKHLQAHHESLKKKPKVAVVADTVEQAAFIIDRVMTLSQENNGLSNVVVLFRSTFQSADVQLQLTKHNIPYIVRGGIRYFEQAHIKDVLACLRALLHAQDELSWRRALCQLEGIGPTRAQKLWRYIQTAVNIQEGMAQAAAATPPKQQAIVAKFLTQLTEAHTLLAQDTKNIGKALRSLVDNHYKTYAKRVFDKYRERMEDLEHLIRIAETYDNLEVFLSDMTLSEQFQKEENTTDTSPLVLSTIHQAKGLEWDKVILIGLRENWFPHERSVANDKELDEERRLFYVAVTRAKKELTLVSPLVYAKYGGGEMGRTSRFITELDSSLYDSLELNNDTTIFRDDEETVINADDDRPNSFLNFYLKQGGE